MRYAPQFDSLHPDHISESAGWVGAPSLATIASERDRVVVADRITWDWTSDGSEHDPYWLANSAVVQRHRVLGLAGPPSPLP
jgi:hypothetical protein